VWGKTEQGKFYRCSANGEIVRTESINLPSHRRRPDEWLTHQDKHEPLIPRKLFQKVQAKLAANKARTSPSRKRGTYSLAQLLVCSHCGRYLYGTKVNGYPVYRCGSNMSLGGCAPRIVRESIVLEHLTEALRVAVLAPENKSRLQA